MDVPGQSSTLAAVLALLLASSMVEGASFVREPAHLTGDTVSQGIIRAGRAANDSSNDDSGQSGAGGRSMHWLGRHWYIIVVFLVVFIVVFVFVCGCVLKRSKLGSHHLQMHHNGTRYSPRVSSMLIAPPLATERHLPPPDTVEHGSFQPEDRRDTSATPCTEGLTTVDTATNSRDARGTNSLRSPPTAATPPVDEACSDSPWSFIHSFSKAHSSSGGASQSQRGKEGRIGRDKSRQLEQQQHHSFYHRGKFNSHHSKRFSNPLARANGVKDDSEVSLCSLPSTSGSMHSDHSNPSSQSNMSSRSTVVEVNVRVRLSPDQLGRAKNASMAALAESARQLAESAANLGCREEQAHTRSLPHSPCPPPRRARHHPRHPVTGAPLTPPSLPHSTAHLGRRNLYQSHSSSHLPPPPPSSSSLLCGSDCIVGCSSPGSPRVTSHTISLDRKGTSSRRYYPISLAVQTGSGYGTEDEGTVVSLDRNSSSSSCHCPSTATYVEPGQRSRLTHSPPGKKKGGGSRTLVNLDRRSPDRRAGENDADVTVVSLDRLGDPQDKNRDSFCKPCNKRGSSQTPKQQLCNSSKHHTGNVTTYLNLDSPLENTPTIRQPSISYNSLHSHAAMSASSAGEECHVVNGYTYHHYLPLQQSYATNLVSSTSPSPSLVPHQQLQNISEQGESEFFHSSDNNVEVIGDESVVRDGGRKDKQKRQVANSSSRRLAEPDLLLQATEMERESLKCANLSATKRSKKTHRKERQTENRVNGAGLTPGRGDRDAKEAGKHLRDTENQQTEETHHTQALKSETLALPDPQQDIPLHPESSLSPQSHTGSSICLSVSPSSLPDRAQSPPRSSSALSVSEPLGSTASGYAATGESGSTCDVEPSQDREFHSEFEDIQRALFEARSQFSYPLQRLLDLDYQLEGSGTGLRSDLPHSKVT